MKAAESFWSSAEGSALRRLESIARGFCQMCTCRKARYGLRTCAGCGGDGSVTRAEVDAPGFEFGIEGEDALAMHLTGNGQAVEQLAELLREPRDGRAAAPASAATAPERGSAFVFGAMVIAVDDGGKLRGVGVFGGDGGILFLSARRAGERWP